jgi:hypothetical protein
MKAALTLTRFCGEGECGNSLCLLLIRDRADVAQAMGTAIGDGGSFNQPRRTHFGRISPHWTGQIGYFILKAHAAQPVFIFIKPPAALSLVRLLTLFMLKE